MNAVGIDVPKGKSMIAVMRPFGEVVVTPYEVRHTASELQELAHYFLLDFLLQDFSLPRLRRGRKNIVYIFNAGQYH